MNIMKQALSVAVIGLFGTNLIAANMQNKNSEDDSQKLLGYSIGQSIARSIKNEPISGDKDMIVQGFADGILDQSPKYDDNTMGQALMAYQKQLLEQEADTKAELVTKNSDKLLNQDAVVIGNPEAKITLVEFVDYQCGFCKRMQPIMHNIIKTNNDVKIILKDFIIHGDTSEYAAKAVLAAKAQNKAIDLHNALMSFKGQLTKQGIDETAKSLNIDIEKLKTAINSYQVDQAIRQNSQLALDMQVTGTPALVLLDSAHNKDSKTAPVYIGGAVSEEKLALAIDALNSKLQSK